MHQNLNYKIIAVLLAVALWFYVLLTEENPIIERKLTVPLQPWQMASGLVASGYPDRVEVLVQGPKRLVGSLSENAITARLDLASVRPGTRQVPVVAMGADEVTVVRLHPSRVSVKVEQVASKTMRVEYLVLGTPPPGVMLGQVRLEPAMVRVSGAHSLVEQVEHTLVTVNAELAGLAESQVSVRAVNEYGMPIPGVKLEPGRVRVRVEAERKLDYKTVPITVQVTGVAEGWQVKSVTVEPAVVTLGGDTKVLAGVDYLAVGPLDLGKQEVSTHRETLELKAPAGLLLLDAKRAQVSVHQEPLPAPQVP